MSYIASEDKLLNIKNTVSSLLTKSKTNSLINTIQNGNFNVSQKAYSQILVGPTTQYTVNITGTGIAYIYGNMMYKVTVDGNLFGADGSDDISSQFPLHSSFVGIEFNSSIKIEHVKSRSYVFYVVCLY